MQGTVATVARAAMILAASGMLLAGQAQAAEPRYADVLLSDVKDGGAAKKVYARDTAKIFLSAKLVDVSAGAKLTAVWIAEKTKVAAPNYRIDSADVTVGALTNRVHFSLSKPTAGWPEGDYRVELLINGKPATSVRFKVAP